MIENRTRIFHSLLLKESHKLSGSDGRKMLILGVFFPPTLSAGLSSYLSLNVKWQGLVMGRLARDGLKWAFGEGGGALLKDEPFEPFCSMHTGQQMLGLIKREALFACRRKTADGPGEMPRRYSATSMRFLSGWGHSSDAWRRSTGLICCHSSKCVLTKG